ncbi:MAG: hypothetical protein HC837_11115 [Chloroflexaceae bacterium]|nr:hypothetical protein [Chloroflexaceae bacterium]
MTGRYHIAITVICSVLLFIGCSSIPEVATTDMLLQATFAKSLSENQEPINPTDTFLPTESINLSLEFEGRPKRGNVKAVYYLDDALITDVSVDIATANNDVIASVGQNTFVGFTLSPSQPFPVSDGYRVETFLNDEPLGTYMFQVVAP